MYLFKNKPSIRRVFIIVKRTSDASYLLLIANKKHVPFGLSGGRFDQEDKDPKYTAHRELFEETSLDIDSTRFNYLGLLDNKLFYFLEITDTEANSIKLSHEHIDFIFYKNKENIPKLIKYHSSGTCSNAFNKFMDVI